MLTIMHSNIDQWGERKPSTTKVAKDTGNVLVK